MNGDFRIKNIDNLTTEQVKDKPFRYMVGTEKPIFIGIITHADEEYIYGKFEHNDENNNIAIDFGDTPCSFELDETPKEKENDILLDPNFYMFRFGGGFNRTFNLSQEERQEPISYTIISKPSYIKLNCPYCKEDIEVPFDEVGFKTDYWGDGAWYDCPECGKEIELGDWEYD